MSRETEPIDVSDVPELLHLAEEVRATRSSRLLRRADDDLALLVPIDAPARDVEALIAQLHQNREARTHDHAGPPDTLQVLRRLRARRMQRLTQR